MKPEKITAIIFSFIVYVFIILLVAGGLNNNLPSRQLENDKTLLINNIIFKENKKFIFDDGLYYQEGIKNYQEITAQQSYTLVQNRVDLSKDLTIYIKVKDYDFTNYTITIKDFAPYYKVYLNDKMLYEQNNKSASVNTLEINNTNLSEYYIIIVVPKSSEVKKFATIDKLIFTSDKYQYQSDTFYKLVYGFIIGILFLNLMIIATMFLGKRFDLYTFPIAVANIISIISISITNLGLLKNVLDFQTSQQSIELFKMIIILINILTCYMIYQEEAKNKIPKLLIIIAAIILVILSLIYIYLDISLLILLTLIQTIYIIYYSFYLFIFKKNNLALAFIVAFSFFFCFSTYEMLHLLNRHAIQVNVYLNNFFIGQLVFIILFIFYTFINQLKKINYADKIIANDYNNNLLFSSKINESTKALMSQNEQLNEAYNKLMSSQENKQNLMLNISHDLRTPIAIIDGYIQVFSDSSLSEEEKNKYLSRIDAKLNYLKKLIGDLFLLAKIEEGNFKLIEETVDIVNFTNNLIGDYKFLAENKKLEYNIELAQGNLMKNIDVTQYPRIIENIITNAIKYTQPGGKIKIVSDVINDKFRIIVSDTGIGIDEKDLPKLFGSYYLQKRKSNRNDSSGIGLYITKQLVDRHKAKLWIESEKGKGTTVFFEI